MILAAYTTSVIAVTNNGALNTKPVLISLMSVSEKKKKKKVK